MTRGCFAGPKTYSGSCSGNLFSERLVDPHDVDQTYESAHNACVTWVIEEAPVELVSVGSSDGATKTVKVPGVLGAEPVPVNEIPPSEASILFDVKVEQESGTIVVQRVDPLGRSSGWNMDLQIRARLDPVEAGGGGSASVHSSAMSGFVDIGTTKWLRRGRLYSKEHETETTVDWLKEELGLEPGILTDVALKQACAQLGVRFTDGASTRRLCEQCSSAVLEEVRETERLGLFMSHAQHNGGPQIRGLKKLLQEQCEELRGPWDDEPGSADKIWLDVDETPSEAGMKDGVRKNAAFLIFLTRGYLTRYFCQKEIRWALRYQKRIVSAATVGLSCDCCRNSDGWPPAANRSWCTRLTPVLVTRVLVTISQSALATSRPSLTRPWLCRTTPTACSGRFPAPRSCGRSMTGSASEPRPSPISARAESVPTPLARL